MLLQEIEDWQREVSVDVRQDARRDLEVALQRRGRSEGVDAVDFSHGGCVAVVIDGASEKQSVAKSGPCKK